MLTIFANSFMTATRLHEPKVRDARKPQSERRRWLPEGHWWIEKPHTIDLNDL